MYDFSSEVGVAVCIALQQQHTLQLLKLNFTSTRDQSKLTQALNFALQ